MANASEALQPMKSSAANYNRDSLLSIIKRITSRTKTNSLLFSNYVLKMRDEAGFNAQMMLKYESYVLREI